METFRDALLLEAMFIDWINSWGEYDPSYPQWLARDWFANRLKGVVS